MNVGSEFTVDGLCIISNFYRDKDIRILRTVGLSRLREVNVISDDTVCLLSDTSSGLSADLNFDAKDVYKGVCVF